MIHQIGQVSLPRATSDDATLRAKARRENFPVATVLIPPRYRRHLVALYGFARLVDDIGDEATGDRTALLDSVTSELDLLFSGEQPTEARFRRLAVTVRSLGLRRDPFDKLVRANRQDQVVSRYSTFDQLADYCALSANPVGELVLGVFGMDGADRRSRSDRICTALQLLEHSQDIAEDYAAGRVYVPTEDLERFGVSEEDFALPAAGRSVRALIGYQVQRAVGMLDDGAELVRMLHGAGRVAVAGYVAGGYATAKALSRADFDVLAWTPRPTMPDVAVESLRLLTGRDGAK